MYIVHFQKSHSKRYDDPGEMGRDIKEWLQMHPKRKVTVALLLTAMRCDRQQFIDCVNGDLMIRDEKGNITHLGDAATSVVAACESGQTVTLTIDGKDVSIIAFNEELGAYEEREL